MLLTINDIPDRVQTGHDSNEENKVLQCYAVCDEPERYDESGHDEEEDPYAVDECR